MAYAHDLLRLAQQIANLYPEEAHQPSLRRALSTAYYALFHLLISEATANCGDPRFRAALSRVFDHGTMKAASEKKVSEINTQFRQNSQQGPEWVVKDNLYKVAETFLRAQYDRNEADYNLVRGWQPTEVSLLIEEVADAFNRWNLIRDEPAARDYLMSMLPSKERRQPEKPRPERRPPAKE